MRIGETYKGCHTRLIGTVGGHGIVEGHVGGGKDAPVASTR